MSNVGRLMGMSAESIDRMQYEAGREEGRREVMAEWSAFKERNLLALTPQAIADEIDATSMALLTAGMEMGRREVLREIAALDPMEYNGGSDCCFFCYAEEILPHGPVFGYEPPKVVHADSCLWLRAQAVKG